jgi:hypothetical protein
VILAFSSTTPPFHPLLTQKPNAPTHPLFPVLVDAVTVLTKINRSAQRFSDFYLA